MRAGLLGLIVVLLLAVPALAAEEGVVEGKVVNKTPGGSSVAGIELTLHTYSGETEKEQVKATTDNEGRFSFTGLNTGPEYSYDITLIYQEADYTSQRVSFEEEPTLSLEIEVYDATSSPQDLKMSQAHTVIQPQGKDIVVLEMFVLENTGLRTYVGSQVVPTLGRKETLRFLLPQGAGPVTPHLGLMECCIVAQPGALIDTMAVPPGTRQIAFSYAVQGQKSILFQKRLDFPTDNLSLLVEDQGLKVEVQGLSPAEPVVIQDVTYQRYEATQLPAGATIAFTISGLSALGMEAPFRWALTGALAVALGAGLVYSLSKRPAAVRAPRSSRQDLLLTIARLDEDFEAGKIPEARYRHQRAEMMARLLRLRR